MKVLFTSPMIEYPSKSGPHLRIENSIKALAKVSELHILSAVPEFLIGGKVASQYFQDIAHTFHFLPSAKNLSSFKWVRRAQKLLNALWVDDAKALTHYAKQHKVDAIWFGFGNISYPLIKQIYAQNMGIPLICDTDSVWSRFISRELPFIQDEQERKRIREQAAQKEQEEKSWVQMCDITTAVSEVDAEYYQGLTSNKNKIAVFSNVLDIDNYAEKVAPPLGLKSPAIYLAGSFGKPTSAMNRAATWLLNDILPLVKKKIPNIHCYIVGNHSDISFGHIKEPHITITGRLESVLPYLKNIDVALTPLHFESGTRFKILEAAACKIPMVSTTLGAEGLPVKDNEHILIADTTESFANAIIKLIQDKQFAQQLAENSHQMVQQHFGIDRLKQEALAIFDRIKQS